MYLDFRVEIPQQKSGISKKKIKGTTYIYYERLAPWKKSYGQPRQHIKKQRHYFTCELDYKES